MDTAGNVSQGVTISAPPRARTMLSISGSTSLVFTLEELGVPPSNQAVMICGGGVNWIASASENWVVLSAASGSAPYLLLVGIDPVEVSPASCTATVELSGSDTGDTVLPGARDSLKWAGLGSSQQGSRAYPIPATATKAG